MPNIRIEVDHTPRKDSDYSKTVVSALSSEYLRIGHLPGDEGGQEGEGEVGGDQRQTGARVEIVSRVEIVRLVPHRVHTVENLK